MNSLVTRREQVPMYLAATLLLISGLFHVVILLLLSAAAAALPFFRVTSEL